MSRKQNINFTGDIYNKSRKYKRMEQIIRLFLIVLVSSILFGCKDEETEIDDTAVGTTLAVIETQFVTYINIDEISVKAYGDMDVTKLDTYETPRLESDCSNQKKLYFNVRPGGVGKVKWKTNDKSASVIKYCQSLGSTGETEQSFGVYATPENKKEVITLSFNCSRLTTTKIESCQ